MTTTSWLTHDAAGFFTLWLVIVGGAQIGLFYWQLRYMRKGVDDAAVAAKAAQQSADTARDAFTKLERPYIYIFGATGLEIDLSQEDLFYSLKYSIANYGKTPASITGAYISISVGLLPQEPLPVGVWHNFMVLPILIPGERRNDVEEGLPDKIEIGEAADENSPPHPVPELSDDKAFFLWVKIKYSGPFSEGHETSTCWQWDRKSERLILYGGEEYNYTR